MERRLIRRAMPAQLEIFELFNRPMASVQVLPGDSLLMGEVLRQFGLMGADLAAAQWIR